MINASVATTNIPRGRGNNTGIKYEAEGKDFWYQLCVKYDENKETKYDNCMADFLDHEDSGPGVSNENKYRKKMSRYYKQFKEGKLTAGMGQRKRSRSRKHEDIEKALIREFCGIGGAIPKKKELRKMAMRIAEKLGKRDTFKASQVWLESVSKRARIQVHVHRSSPNISPTELPKDACNAIEPRSTAASGKQSCRVSPSRLPDLEISDLEFDATELNVSPQGAKKEGRDSLGEEAALSRVHSKFPGTFFPSSDGGTSKLQPSARSTTTTHALALDLGVIADNEWQYFPSINHSAILRNPSESVNCTKYATQTTKKPVTNDDTWRPFSSIYDDDDAPSYLECSTSHRRGIQPVQHKTEHEALYGAWFKQEEEMGSFDASDSFPTLNSANADSISIVSSYSFMHSPPELTSVPPSMCFRTLDTEKSKRQKSKGSRRTPNSPLLEHKRERKAFKVIEPRSTADSCDLLERECSELHVSQFPRTFFPSSDGGSSKLQPGARSTTTTDALALDSGAIADNEWQYFPSIAILRNPSESANLTTYAPQTTKKPVTNDTWRPFRSINGDVDVPSNLECRTSHQCGTQSTQHAVEREALYGAGIKPEEAIGPLDASDMFSTASDGSFSSESSLPKLTSVPPSICVQTVDTKKSRRLTTKKQKSKRCQQDGKNTALLLESLSSKLSGLNI